MYTYEAFWVVPRARWTEFEKVNPAVQKVMDKAIASGVLVSYGSDSFLLHDADGATHDNWWQSMSMAGTLTVLDDLENVGSQQRDEALGQPVGQPVLQLARRIVAGRV